VCLEYDFRRIIDTEVVDWLPSEVEYADEQPQLNVLDFKDTEADGVKEFIRQALHVKTRRWAVEEEVRVVYEVGDSDPPKVQVPASTITGLYLGPAISDHDRATCLGWNARVPVYQTDVDSNGGFSFRLLRSPDSHRVPEGLR
jgi:hypothetical protein